MKQAAKARELRETPYLQYLEIRKYGNCNLSVCDGKQEKQIHMARFSINTKTWNLFPDARVCTQREPAAGASRESPSILGLSLMVPKG